MPAAANFFNFWRIGSRGISLLDAAFFLHDFLIMLLDVALHDPDIFHRQDRHDRHDLLVRALLLEVGNQVLHSDAAGGELRPPAAIDDLDIRLHGTSSRDENRFISLFYRRLLLTSMLLLRRVLYRPSRLL